jgi:hypothetical protein
MTKKERVVARKGRLLEERAVTPQAFFKSNLDSSWLYLAQDAVLGRERRTVP